MAQAVREFVTGMTFPPESEKGGHSSNTLFAGVILALLSHARNLRLGDVEVTVDPALRQIADLLHCSPRTVRRHIEALQGHGMVYRTVRKGHSSNLYTIIKHSRKHPRPDKHVPSPNTEREDKHVPSESSRERTTQPERPDNPGKETGQPTQTERTHAILLRSKPSQTLRKEDQPKAVPLNL